MAERWGRESGRWSQVGLFSLSSVKDSSDRLIILRSLYIPLTSRDAAVSTVSQSLLYTASEPGKLLAIRNLVSSGQLPYPSLVFVQSVARAEELTKTLILDGLRVDSVHGSRTPAQREAAVRGFREGSVWILVVTEVLARGMDFRGVKVVVNYGELGL